MKSQHKIAAGIVVLALILVVGCLTTRAIVYSEGHRDGYVMKISKKGIIFKTWEGELALAGIGPRKPGSAQDGAAGFGSTWEFTVSDQTVVDELNAVHAGQLVRLHYVEYLWNPPISGQTSYRITKVERLSE